MASTNGLPVPALSSANNPPADFLALANAVDAAYGGSVANWAALPATGNFAGKKLWVTDVKVVATWNGTGWVQALPVSSTGISASDKGAAQDVLGVGLVNVIPPTIRVSGGSATSNTLGKISFTTATAIGLDGIFTSNYSTYKILVETTAVSANNSLALRFTTSGTPTSASLFYGGSGYVNQSTLNAYAYSVAVADIGIATPISAGYTALLSSTELTISKTTAGIRVSTQSSTFPGGTAGLVFGGHLWNEINSTVDGIKLYPSAGNFSGTVQVLAINY